MKVLIISGAFLPMSSSRLQFSPSGVAYIAGAARKAGHKVEVFDCFVANKLIDELKVKLSEFNPDVIGISITFVTSDILDEDSEFGTKYFDMRPEIKRIVDTIKQNTNAPVVLGGPGFNYYGKEWLNYLNLDYGLRGEGEYSFPLYLNRHPNDGRDQSETLSGLYGPPSIDGWRCLEFLSPGFLQRPPSSQNTFPRPLGHAAGSEVCKG